MNMLESIKNILQKIRHFFAHMGEGGIFALWVVAIVLSGSLIWGLTNQVRANVTIQAVNRHLAEIGEERRVVSAIDSFALSGRATQAGMWCRLSSNEKAVIFPLITNGIFSPCLGIINSEGNLANIIPLSANAKTAVERINRSGILQSWIRRIETSSALLP
jgi:hypothetical protein